MAGQVDRGEDIRMGVRQNKPRHEQEGEATAGGTERGAQEEMDSLPQGYGHPGATVLCLSLIPHHLGWDPKDRGSL